MKEIEEEMENQEDGEFFGMYSNYFFFLLNLESSHSNKNWT